VFFLLGNHESYGLRYEDAVDRVCKFEARIVKEGANKGSNLGAFVFLNRTRFDLSENVTVLGCTLFSSIAKEQTKSVSQFVSDFTEIQDWNVALHNRAHQRDLDWLNNQVSTITKEKNHREIVIFTHYSPTRLAEANDPRHLKDASEIISAFVTDLSGNVCWKSSLVRIWAFGHTHFNCNFRDPITGKMVVTNQKGYSRHEKVDFDKDLVVSITYSDERRAKVGRQELCTKPCTIQ
jgi:hypothetical protein